MILGIKNQIYGRRKKWPETITYWYKISEKTVDLVVSQSERLLKETITAAQSLQDKSDKLTGLIVPAVSALVIYLCTQKGQWYDFLNLTAGFSVIVLLVSLCFLYFNINTYIIRPEGHNPDIYLNNVFISETDTPADQYLQIALQACKEYKEKIANNINFNYDYSNRYKAALKILMIGLPVSPILAIILNQYLVCYL